MRANYKICLVCHKPIDRIPCIFWTGEMEPFRKHTWKTYRSQKNPPGLASYHKNRAPPDTWRSIRIGYRCECGSGWDFQLLSLHSSYSYLKRFGREKIEYQFKAKNVKLRYRT